MLFAAILAVNRVFVAEREQGGFDAIRLAPIDKTALYAAKVAILVIYLVCLEAIALPVFAIFFGGGSGLLALVPVLLLLDLGLAAVGALVSSIAVNSRARDLIAPLLLLPLLGPGDDRRRGRRRAAARRRRARSYDGFGKWLAVLALYDLVFLAVGYAVYDFLVED